VRWRRIRCGENGLKAPNKKKRRASSVEVAGERLVEAKKCCVRWRETTVSSFLFAGGIVFVALSIVRKKGASCSCPVAQKRGGRHDAHWRLPRGDSDVYRVFGVR
jgi:hypothetical protein